MRRSIARPAATMFALILAPALRAQSVNYADLQDVFGEPVTTSVTGKPQRASDAPASIVIITRAEIAQSPARNVPDLLKAYAGIDVNRWTAGQSDVAVRGGVQTYNARLLVLVNGRQVYLDHYGMTDWNLLGIQVEDIQQIELVRGPASALFGFNAASGVVNIITADPRERARATVTAEGGNHGYRRLAGSVGTPIGDAVALQLAGGHLREDERAIPDTLNLPPRIEGVAADDATVRLAVQPGATTRIDLTGGWARNRQLEFLPSQVLAEQRFRSFNAGLVVDHDTPWGSLSGRAYTNWLTARYGIGGTPSDALAVQPLAVHNRVTDAQVAALARLGDEGTARIEGEYRSNELVSDRIFSHRVGYDLAAASAMLEVRPIERVSLTGAIRGDHLMLSQKGAIAEPAFDRASDYKRNITRISFNAAALIAVGDSGQVRLNGGRGFQIPSLIDFAANIPVALAASPIPFRIGGDPTIEPVVVWSGEAGFGRRFGDALRIDATAFLTDTGHAIASPGDAPVYTLIVDPQPVVVSRFANVGHFRGLGLELAASGKATAAFSWHVSYTWKRVRQDLPQRVANFSYAFSPRDTTPAHVATIGLNYASGPWFATADGRYTSATRQFAFYRDAELVLVHVPRAATIDGKVGRRFGSALTAYVAGENLGDARGAYGSPIPADRRVRMGVSLRL